MWLRLLRADPSAFPDWTVVAPTATRRDTQSKSCDVLKVVHSDLVSSFVTQNQERVGRTAENGEPQPMAW